MKVIIETIPHDQQRYNTCGDWYWDEADGQLLHIKISKLPYYDSTAILLIGVHELIEALLCNRQAISQNDVDDFDMKWRGEGEPGDSPTAPYHRQHFIATTIERILAQHMNIDWKQYEAEIEKLG